MGRSQLYKLVGIACLAGYVWLAFLHFKGSDPGHDLNVCLIKQATEVPCPSCGTSRSVLAFMDGDLMGALKWNPMGIIVVIIMIISPWWILYDLTFVKDSFLRFYHQTEKIIRNKWVAFPMIALVMANWVWNILKGF